MLRWVDLGRLILCIFSRTELNIPGLTSLPDVRQKLCLYRSCYKGFHMGSDSLVMHHRSSRLKLPRLLYDRWLGNKYNQWFPLLPSKVAPHLENCWTCNISTCIIDALSCIWLPCYFKCFKCYWLSVLTTWTGKCFLYGHKLSIPNCVGWGCQQKPSTIVLQYYGSSWQQVSKEQGFSLTCASKCFDQQNLKTTFKHLKTTCAL